ncbi:hypothetical protein MRB53_024631 [Persea americana]|uniref:Uncharacterized protein n=1 Tax=Persea americana TaxID=3435 RepID=A0ACC2LDR2_PERAE|nr:hypothetical protein MRB53_024631 [Persea americana]
MVRPLSSAQYFPANIPPTDLGPNLRHLVLIVSALEPMRRVLHTQPKPPSGTARVTVDLEIGVQLRKAPCPNVSTTKVRAFLGPKQKRIAAQVAEEDRCSGVLKINHGSAK